MKNWMIALTGWTALLSTLLGASSALSGEAINAHELFSALANRRTERARIDYLKARAGFIIRGSGRLEVLTARTYYDASAPDDDPMVAVLFVGQSRTAACGLSRSVLDELGWLREGAPVAFEGRLVDAQGWNGSSTLYLSRCSLSRRTPGAPPSPAAAASR